MLFLIFCTFRLVKYYFEKQLYFYLQGNLNKRQNYIIKLLKNTKKTFREKLILRIPSLVLFVLLLHTLSLSLSNTWSHISLSSDVTSFFVSIPKLTKSWKTRQKKTRKTFLTLNINENVKGLMLKRKFTPTLGIPYLGV